MQDIMDQISIFIREDTSILQNIWLAIGIVVLFKLLSFPLSHLIIRMFTFKSKSKRKTNGITSRRYGGAYHWNQENIFYGWIKGMQSNALDYKF